MHKVFLKKIIPYVCVKCEMPRRKHVTLSRMIPILHNYMRDVKLSHLVNCEVNHNKLKPVESDKLIRHSIGTK